MCVCAYLHMCVCGFMLHLSLALVTREIFARCVEMLLKCGGGGSGGLLLVTLECYYWLLK